MKHPLAVIALLYAGGVLLGRYVPLSVWILIGVSLAVALFTVSHEKSRPGMLALLLFLLGWTNLTARTSVLSPFDLRMVFGDNAEVVTLRGTLLATPEQRLFVRDDKPSWRTLARVEVAVLERRTGLQRAFGVVAVSTPGVLDPGFCSGLNVRITGALQRPRPAAAEGLFDYQAFLREQGIYYLLKTESTNDWQRAFSNGRPARQPWSDRFGSWAKRTLAMGLPEEDEPLRLLWAMVLGWKPALTQEVEEPFMQSGTLHIFAISGLHIALIAEILVGLLRLLQVPRSVCGLVVIPLIWFYTAATGWQASAIRSTVMMSIIIGGWALKRPTNLLNSLAGAGLIILLWEPRQLFEAGFQLSFFVVLGLALIAPPLARVRDWLLRPDPLLPDDLRPRWQLWLRGGAGYLATGLATSLAAWLGSLPLIAYYFYMVTPVSLGANLVIVPLSSLALASSLGSLICGEWLPWFTVLFNHGSWFWMKLMIAASHWAADLPLAYFYVRSPSLLEFIVYYSVLALVMSGWALRAQRWRWSLPAITVVLVVMGLMRFRDRADAEITILPLGGSGIVVDAPGRESDLLIDSSDAAGADLMIKPFLKSRGMNGIDRLVLTHGDLHHVGGFRAIASDFPIASVLTGPLRFRSPAYRSIIEDLDRSGQGRRQIQRGDRIGNWRVLHPQAGDRFGQADDGTIVLMGTFHQTRILLLSDLGKIGQQRLLEREGDLRADVVVAGIPAQGEPLNDALLNMIQPRVAVIASAEFPSSARLTWRLRERLENAEMPLISTDITGAVTLVIRERECCLRAMNETHLLIRTVPPH